MMDQTTPQNPLEQGPQPEFPEQEQPLPGLEQQMAVKPDYGEETYKGSGRLEGKTAIITGGDSGIGRAVALAFAREGADVVIAYLPEEEPDAQEVVQVVQEAGRKALTVPGDIGDEAQCQQIVERTMQEFGKIDILVNNAAYQKLFESIEEVTAEEIDRHFRTNIFAMFYLCKAALPHMQSGATIINVGSIQAYQPSSSLLPYATTKGAITTFSKGLAQQVIQQGIRVNVVAPGPVWTPLIPASMPEEQASQFGANSPMQRPAQPKELAPAFVFLASQESSYITGEVLGVTGGQPLP